MPSDAGGASVRQRLDLSTLFSLSLFCISLVSFDSSSMISILSKHPNSLSHVFFFPESFLCDGRVNLCSIGSDLSQTLDPSLSLKPKSEDPQQFSGSLPQTSEQVFIDLSLGSRSGLATPPLVPSHRISLMAGVSLGPSDVHFPVRTSTAHDELKSWLVVSLYASPPTITPIFQNGGCVFLLPTTSTLGFGWMGLIFCCGPISHLWPISRSDFSVFKLSRSLQFCFSIVDGRGLHPTVGTNSLEETCLFIYRNLMDSVDCFSPDATLIVKLSGLVFFSNLICCDAIFAPVPICVCILRIYIPTSKPNHVTPSLMGEASQPSQTFWIKPPQRKLHPSSAAFFVYWTCEFPWRIQQTYSSMEIPSLEPYFGSEEKPPPATSSMEHLFESSLALIVRAYYDHKLIRDFVKLVFKFESLKAPTDLPTFAIFLKLCILENSWNLYPYLSCSVLNFSCMNSPLTRF